MSPTAPSATPRTRRAIEVVPGRSVPEWLLLTLVCVGQFMVVLDVSIVNVALPSIQKDLGFSASGLQWVVNAYTLTFAGFMLLGGRAADLFGRRRIFIAGLTIFTISSLIGGLSQSQAMLIGARALQGFGAAILAPATLTIITATFTEPSSRARALGVWSAVASAGASAGALLGGILTDLLSWRWILFVNVPIGILALVFARRFIPESRADLEHRQLDVAGALSVTGGLVALVYAIVRTQTYAWTSVHTLIPLGIAVVSLGTFFVIQTRSRVPLVPLRIFRSRSVAGGNAVIFLLFGAMFGSWYFETLFMQRVLGFSPLQAGLAFLPQTVLIAIGAQITARYVTRVGPRPLILLGSLVGASGLFWLSQVTPHSTFVGDLFGPYVLIGLGMGLAVTPVTVAGTSGVAPADAGLASGLLNTSRIVGASIGLAVLTTVAANHTSEVFRQLHVTRPAAITDGYALALTISGVVLVLGGLVAMVTLPSLRAMAKPASMPSKPDVDGELVPVLADGDGRVDGHGDGRVDGISVDGSRRGAVPASEGGN
jgi:EmrB/QacA subfamily drug resistance transporter